jgi:hypothetical protein
MPLDILKRADIGSSGNQFAQEFGFIVIKVEEEPAQVLPIETE